ncbi:MAG: hypothetical protein ACLFO2_02280 [Candidatus Woesearchaeota archaeon]
MPEQEVSEDAVVVPELDEDDKQAIRDEVREAAEKKGYEPQKRCIICGAPATHCMRGLPNNTYCKACAKDYFKFLSYLERL